MGCETTTQQKKPYPNPLGLTTWIMSYHFTWSRAISVIKSQAPVTVTTTSTQVNIGPPLTLLTPSTCTISLFLISAVIGLHHASPNHLSQLSFILSPIGATPKISWLNSFMILSFLALLLIRPNIFFKPHSFYAYVVSWMPIILLHKAWLVL